MRLSISMFLTHCAGPRMDASGTFIWQVLPVWSSARRQFSETLSIDHHNNISGGSISAALALPPKRRQEGRLTPRTIPKAGTRSAFPAKRYPLSASNSIQATSMTRHRSHNKQGKPAAKVKTTTHEHPDEGAKQMLEVPIFMMHSIPDHMTLAAVQYTHGSMRAVPGKKLRDWLVKQVKDFRTKAFQWVTPRVARLVSQHGPIRKWENAGYQNRLAVWYRCVSRLCLN